MSEQLAGRGRGGRKRNQGGIGGRGGRGTTVPPTNGQDEAASPDHIVRTAPQ